MELGSLMGGMQTIWHATADGWNERTAAVHNDYAADEAGAPKLANANTINGWSLWGKAYYGSFDREASQSLTSHGNTFNYDTGYTQDLGGIQAGTDWMTRDSDGGAWVLGALVGYNKSSMDDAFVKEATGSAKATVTLYAADGKSLDFGIPVNGLDKAIAAIRK